MELSFATRDDVLTLVESLINRLWRELLDISLPTSFPRITYEKAMLEYGSDKPDTRLGMPISKITPFLPADLISKLTALSSPVIEAIVLHSSRASPAETRKLIKGFLDLPSSSVFHKNPAGGPGVFIYDPTQPLQGLEAFGFEAALKISTNLSLQPGDLLILQARPDTAFTGGSTPLGNLRVALHKVAVQASHISPPIGFDPLWIVDFPLFTPISPNPPSSDIPTPAATLHPTQTSHPTLSSTHHPFTSPLGPSDVSLLLTSPDRALGDHYDLVLNGVELGGGSRRIHHAGLQSMILSSILKLPPARLAEFDHLIEVLRAGCPPHAGFALGFDRLVALMLGRESVRDVIAFPKSGKGEDLLVGSPGIMEEDVLKTYHLKIRE